MPKANPRWSKSVSLTKPASFALAALPLTFSLVLGTAGCGGGAETQAAAASTTPVAPPTTDVTLDLDVKPLSGWVFVPDALTRPGMPLVEPKRKVTIEKARANYAKAKADERETFAQILATLLYTASKTETDPGKEKALFAEAAKALTDTRAALGDKATDVTLRMLGVYDLIVGDYPGAESAYAALYTILAADTKTAADAQEVTTWLAWAQLKQNKHAEAARTLGDATPTKDAPERDYVLAWTRWEAGDGAGAWAAIQAAVKNWKSASTKPAVDRDLLIIAARSGAPVADQIAVIHELAGGKRSDEYTKLYTLHTANVFAGRYADGSALIDAAIATAGDTVPKNDPPKMRFQQAEYALRLGKVDAVASFVDQALKSLATCGTACTAADASELEKSSINLANLFYTVFATAEDPRFFQPAHDLYASITANAPDALSKADATKYSAQLEQTKKSAKPGIGTSDKTATTPFLRIHDQEVQACYENGLLLNPTLAGSLTLTIEFDATGAAKGVATEPPGGAADLAAVATCAEAHARTWLIPSHSKPGTTKIKLPYQLTPRQPDADKPAAK